MLAPVMAREDIILVFMRASELPATGVRIDESKKFSVILSFSM